MVFVKVIVKRALELQLNVYDQTKCKMELADILLSEEFKEFLIDSKVKVISYLDLC